MPVKAAPVNYVKICSLYGDGFYYIPGTDTCLKIGGYLRVQGEYDAGNGGIVDRLPGVTRGCAGPVYPRPDQRLQLPRPRGAVVGRAPADRIWHAAHLHPVRLGQPDAGDQRRRFHRRTVLGSRVHAVRRLHGRPVAVVLRPLHLRRRIQLPQRTGRRATPARRARTFGPIPPSSATASPARCRWKTPPITGPMLALSTLRKPGSSPSTAACRPGQWASEQCRRHFGFRVPDVVANLRVDQAWGFAGISAVLHDASGGYYNSIGANACGAAVG